MISEKRNKLISLIFAKSNFLFCILILFAFCNSIYPQSLPFGQISVKDGLSNSFVNCVLQDRTGFIWFGTDDGLNRFDGYEIKVYRNNPDDELSISENIIWAMCEDHSGNLWIGTKTGGLNKFNPINNKFEHWSLESDSTEEINITNIYEDSKNILWIGTYKNGLYRFDPSENKFSHWQNTPNKKNTLSNNFVTSVIEDDSSNIWISTYGGLDKFIQDQSNQNFERVYNNPKDIIWCLKKSSFYKNTLWVGSLNGLLKFDVTTKTFSKIPLPKNSNNQFDQSVSSIAEQNLNGEKILWVGTYGGVVKINLSTGYSERFVKNEKAYLKLLSNQIHDIICDKSDVVWIAGENGVNSYSQKRSKFNSMSPLIPAISHLPDLKNISVRAIAQTNDQLLFFGTDAGLSGTQNETITSLINKNPELRSLNIWSLSNGSSYTLWIGTYGQGFKELNLKTKQLKSWKVNNPDFNEAAYHYIKAVLEDKSGMLWIGFWGAGLARLNPQTEKIEYWQKVEYMTPTLSYNDVWTIYEDRTGRIWVGTNGGGLELYKGNMQNSFYNWNSGSEESVRLNSNNVFTICESVNGNKSKDQTILWIGTANGLNKFIIKNDNGSSDGSKLDVEIQYYTSKSGLPDNSIESILEDKNGNLWIGTSSGISFFNTEEEKFTNYTSADGLSGSSNNASAALKLQENVFLFGSTSGINYFVPDEIRKSNYTSPVVITNFEILNQPEEVEQYSLLNQSNFNQSKIELAYDQSDFSFQFVSLDFNAPKENQYSYFMEGFDRDWIYSSNRRFVAYTNLDPGEYVFQVKATNSDGLWSKQIAKIFIVIKPPFWKTWWAYTFYTVAFFGLILLLRAAEIKRRKKKEAERLKREREEAHLREVELKAKNIEQEKEIEKQKIRNRIAQDLHDEIGSNLSSISLMSELIQKDEKTNPEASEKIKRIYKVARSSTQAIRDIVWLTNPSSDSLKDLISKMREVADNTLGKFDLIFDHSKNVDDFNLPPDIKRNVFFIYKETINNIIKHADAKKVKINLDADQEHIFLSICDDGKGFDTEIKNSGNGLKNLKSRAKEINADLKLESRPDCGTILNLSVIITRMRN